ncbi:NAD(+) synthase [Candidatus Aerophobetes bacterium]|nr:NAD(+) synthase [Candidatus Aerophobetes bacterium]
MEPSKVCDKIVEWTKERMKKTRAKGGLFGLSGGVDSSVIAALCQRALGNNTLALIMPCHSDPLDVKYAIGIAEKFGIEAKEICLDAIYDTFIQILPAGGRLACANVKSRIRMTTLYYFANSLNYLVVGTGNKSEITVGYFTKYGDGAADISPLGGLLKTEVLELAKYLGVPEKIINRAPSAGLWPGQTDEAEMGITYRELDEVIQFLEGKIKVKLSEEKIKKVKVLMQNSQHKRESPPVFKF